MGDQNIKTIPAILDGKFYLIQEIEDTGKVKAKCLMCKQKDIIISGTLKATTNFKLHMKRKHQELLEEFSKYKNEKINIKGKRKAAASTSHDHEGKLPALKQMKLFHPKFHKSLTQKQLDKNIIRYIVCSSMKPLSTVDDPNFIKIITDINAELCVMSRRTVMRKIDESYDCVIKRLLEFFHSVEYVSTTADIWSTKHKSFMGVTAHWINKYLVRCSSVLDCRRFKGAHTYDKIAELLYDITSEYGLKHEQLVSTVTDNGSNFVKAFAEFGVPMIFSENDVDLDIQGDYETDMLEFKTIHIEPYDANVEDVTFNSVVLPNHLRCASHTLNLLATTDFNNSIKGSPISRIHHPAFAKCTAIWNAARRPKSSEVIIDLLVHCLIYPCPTRWNYLFNATEQLLNFKIQLNELNSKLGLGAFKQVKIDYLTEFCTLMKPIAVALDFLQKEKKCFYGQLLPTLFSLQHHLQGLQSKTLRHIGFILTHMLNHLNKRFKVFFELSGEANEAILATCFSPNVQITMASKTS